MDPKQSLKRIVAKESVEEEFIESCYIVMKTFGYTLKQIKEMPIPHFNYLLKMIDKENKLQEKERKKSGRRR